MASDAMLSDTDHGWPPGQAYAVDGQAVLLLLAAPLGRPGLRVVLRIFW